MKILITNDDGIYASGLWTLVEELKGIGEILVMAPDREQSAVGSSITLHQPLRISKVRSQSIQGIETCAVEGTPADSVILALRLVAEKGIDVVVSGINKGLNLGSDVFLSGTVGAALQGNFYGIPAIAVSASVVDSKVRFDTAAKIAKLLLLRAQQKSLHPKTLLNVNVPNLPLEEIQGVELTSLGHRNYRDEVTKGNDGKRDYYWIVRGEPQWKEIKGTDIMAIRERKVSITPLRGNLTNPNQMRPLEEICSFLRGEIRLAQR